MSCQDNKQQEQIKQKFHAKYDYLTPMEISVCFDTALKDYVLLRYPSLNNRPKVENIEFDFYVSQWILDRMEDILGRAGGTNVTSYRENGVSFTYASSYIDPHLVAQIMPKGSVPK